MWNGRHDPSGEAAFLEMVQDPDNPIRRVRDLLLEGAKQMIRDGRMKMVDGVPVFSEEVKQLLADREARRLARHARCPKSLPCRNPKAPLLAPPAASEAPSGGPERTPANRKKG